MLASQRLFSYAIVIAFFSTFFLFPFSRKILMKKKEFQTRLEGSFAGDPVMMKGAKEICKEKKG